MRPNLINSLQKRQNRVTRIITDASYLTQSNDFLDQLGWLNLDEQTQKKSHNDV